MTDHDPICMRHKRAGGDCICGELREVREQKMAAADIAFLDAVAARERLADIAAKVEVLATRGVGARVIDGELVTYALVERDEVLALFEEARDD